jgi:anaerobic selenocysteine-containing dehydrogenase
MCGLAIDVSDAGTVVRVRGDRDDPYSRGFICPKGSLLGHVDADPDRLDGPRIRRDGALVKATWDEAFEEAGRLLRPLLEAHGRDSAALFLGNSLAHDVGITLFLPELQRALGSRHVYSSGTLDNMPHNVVAGLLYGYPGSIPVPDVDRTDLLVIVGGNPLVSNGSVGSAPDYPRRLADLRERGGRLIVVDPAGTETAKLADVHIAIRPGTDALFLLAVAWTLFDEDLVGHETLAPVFTGVEAARAALDGFAPEQVAARCGVNAEQIRGLARAIAAAPSAAVYGRLGTTLNRFGTLASWGLALVNVLSGHIDRPGGMMFPESVGGSPTTRPPGDRPPEPVRFGRTRTTVRSAPEVFGEYPAACLAEEILDAGDHRIRALIVLGGNPARSIPTSHAVEAALQSLDALICIGPYIDETARFADVVLPPAGALARPHLDLLLTNYSLRNVAKYSPPVRSLRPGELEEWRILNRLTNVIDPDKSMSDDERLRARRDRLATSIAAELDMPLTDVLAEVERYPGIESILDLRVRTGPFGDQLGRREGLTLATLMDAGHTVDLGPLRPRLAEVVRTPSGKVDLAPPLIVDDLDRLRAWNDEPAPDLVMIGRRSLRSKNSWMHNIARLVSGKNRCTLRLHPADASDRGLADGDDATLTSAAGDVRVAIEFDAAMGRGVCSLPHGWGHDVPGTGRQIAPLHAGVNSNVVGDASVIDPLSGTAELNGIPVTVSPVDQA